MGFELMRTRQYVIVLLRMICGKPFRACVKILWPRTCLQQLSLPQQQKQSVSHHVNHLCAAFLFLMPVCPMLQSRLRGQG